MYIYVIIKLRKLRIIYFSIEEIIKNNNGTIESDTKTVRFS